MHIPGIKLILGVWCIPILFDLPIAQDIKGTYNVVILIKKLE